MTDLIRRSPVSGLIDNFFDDAFFAPSKLRSSATTWIPPVDLSQDDDRFYLRADLPGMTRDDIDLTVEDRTLTLTGSRTFTKTLPDGEAAEGEGKGKQESFSRIERQFGSFTRTFQLPSNVDTSKVEAKFEDGVLTLEIAKLEQAKSRKIKIN